MLSTISKVIIVLGIAIKTGELVHPLLFISIVLYYGALQLSKKVHAVLVATIFIGLCSIGVINFDFLPQAERFLNNDFMDTVTSGDFHVLRFLVSFPAVLLSDTLRLDLDQAFTYYGVIMLYGGTLLILTLIEKLDEANQFSAYMRFYLLVIPVFIVLSLIIHGRSAPAYFGMLVLIFLQIEAMETRKIGTRYVLGNILGIFLSTVSSGMFAVVFGQTVIGLFLILLQADKHFRTKIIFTLAVLGALFVPHLLAGVEKNLEFFNGSIIAMLKHGGGKILLKLGNTPILPVLIFEVLGFALIGGWIIWLFNRYSPTITIIITSIFIGAAGGAFGLLTGTMLIPGLLVAGVLLGTYEERMQV